MRWLKPTVHLFCLLPLGWLMVGAMTDHLGANPIEHLIRATGDWALRFLLITLAITPAARLTGWSRLMTLRRMLGLYAFFYAGLHLFSYAGLDLFFDLGALWRDVLRRRFITVGMLAFVLLIPLAVTSTNAMIKRLGGPRWKRLHRLVYLIAPLAVLHYYWMVKADTSQPLLYAGVLALLLGYRVAATWHQRSVRRRRSPSL